MTDLNFVGKKVYTFPACMKFLHDFPKGEPKPVIEETRNDAKVKEEPLSKQRKVDVKQGDGKEEGSRGGIFRVGKIVEETEVGVEDVTMAVEDYLLGPEEEELQYLPECFPGVKNLSVLNQSLLEIHFQ